MCYVSVCVFICLEYIAKKSAIFCDGIIFMFASHISLLAFTSLPPSPFMMYTLWQETDIYRFICLFLCSYTFFSLFSFTLISIYLSIFPSFHFSSLSSFYLGVWFQLFFIVVTLSFNLLPIVFYLLQRNIRYRYTLKKLQV